MAGGIFLSYRRDDSRHFAGRLYESISTALPDTQIFMDVDSIQFGADFVDVLNEQLKSCQALLVIIGPNWLRKAGTTGKANLDDPDDFIRLEIENAIARKIPLIPVLIDNAEMPEQNEIPESLRPLRRRQFIRINHENYTPVVDRLVSQLSQLIKATPPQRSKPTPPQQPIDTPPQQPMDTTPPQQPEVSAPQTQIVTPAMAAAASNLAGRIGQSAGLGTKKQRRSLIVIFVITLLSLYFVIIAVPYGAREWVSFLVVILGLGAARIVWRRS